MTSLDERLQQPMTGSGCQFGLPTVATGITGREALTERVGLAMLHYGDQRFET